MNQQNPIYHGLAWQVERLAVSGLALRILNYLMRNQGSPLPSLTYMTRHFEAEPGAIKSALGELAEHKVIKQRTVDARQCYLVDDPSDWVLKLAPKTRRRKASS